MSPLLTWQQGECCVPEKETTIIPPPGRRTQVVREQSAKLRCSGSNPLGASTPRLFEREQLIFMSLVLVLPKFVSCTRHEVRGDKKLTTPMQDVTILHS